MAKKSVTAGEYVIEIADNGRVDVLRVFRNAKAIMCDIANKNNFAIAENWTTRELGRNLVKEFGDGETAHFDDITVHRLESGSIEVYQECKPVKPELRKIADMMGYPYEEKWTTQDLGSKLVNYLTEHKEEADKILQTPNRRKSDSSSDCFITLTTDQEIGGTLKLEIIADGEASIEGVKEQLKADGSASYTLTSQTVTIHGAVTKFTDRGGGVILHKNGITSLDLSKCATLTTLECYFSDQLTGLDLSENIALTSLKLYKCTSLKELDLSKNIALTSVDLKNCTSLRGLDLSKNVELTTISLVTCEQLTSLSLPKSTTLSSLRCSTTCISDLDLSKNPALTKLSCTGNEKLTKLDLSKNLELSELNCSANKNLISINLSKNVNLTSLQCCECESLESLDLSSCSKLASLNLSDCGHLKGLDLTKCPLLTNLTCTDKDLPVSELQTLKGLQELDYTTEATSLNLSNLVSLHSLSCDRSKQLKSVDLSGCKDLDDLYVAECDALEVVRCHNDTAKKLDLKDLDIPFRLEKDGETTLLVNKKLNKDKEKKASGSNGADSVIKADPEECPYTLTLSANKWKRSPKIVEFFGYSERTDEVNEIQGMINDGEIDELYDRYIGEGFACFETFNLWGDEDEETITYTIEDEDGNVISEEDMVVEEGSVEEFEPITPYINKDNHPKFLLIRTEDFSYYSSYYQVPSDFGDMEECTFPYRLPIGDDLFWPEWMGDTVTSLSDGIRRNGIEYTNSDYEYEGDTYSNFYLYEYSDSQKRYNMIASTEETTTIVF